MGGTCGQRVSPDRLRRKHFLSWTCSAHWSCTSADMIGESEWRRKPREWPWAIPKPFAFLSAWERNGSGRLNQRGGRKQAEEGHPAAAQLSEPEVGASTPPSLADSAPPAAFSPLAFTLLTLFPVANTALVSGGRRLWRPDVFHVGAPFR